MNSRRTRGRDSPENNTSGNDMERSSMENTALLRLLSDQLENTAEKISSIACTLSGINDIAPDMLDIYEHFLLDEITHVQIITLEMTKIATKEEEGNADDSVFAAGELNSVIGEKRDKPPASKEE